MGGGRGVRVKNGVWVVMSEVLSFGRLGVRFVDVRVRSGVWNHVNLGV